MAAPRRAASSQPTWRAARRPVPSPTTPAISHREYGHRVGIYRVLDVLERHGIRPTVAMDAMTAENYPYLVRHCL